MSGKVSKGNAKVSTTRKFRHKYLPGNDKGAYLPVNCLGIRYVGTISSIVVFGKFILLIVLQEHIGMCGVNYIVPCG